MFIEFISRFFAPAGLTPHGFCLLWEPGLIWLHAVSDAATGLSYFTIPLALFVFVRKRRDLVFKPVFILFAVFIVLCGTGHWLTLLTLWIPAYGLEGAVKAATAGVSILTTVALWVLLPQALALPSPAQFRQLNAELSQRAVALSQLNAELEQFAYIASHDLKAPLQAIARLAKWIREDIQDVANPETLENLDMMQQRATRLEMLITSLLSYSRAGYAKAPAEAVDISGLVDEIVDSLAPPPDFHVQFRGKTIVLLAQRPPIEHVLRNLISNAIKHHDRSAGEIIVSVHMTADGWATFRVEDDGPGIAPEFHQRVFAIFQTLRSRDEVETSGVGLSIVLKTVERAGGKVWIESAPPQRGTSFMFTWPANVTTGDGALAV